MIANIIGTGLIGTSIGLALKSRGWHVCGTDVEDSNVQIAMEMGAIDEKGLDVKADISFVAVPVGELAGAIQETLENTSGVVTDVGSVKAPILNEISNPRFLGGHPMAGNELDGTRGARGNLFEECIWVITPTAATSDQTYAKVHEIIRSLDAEVVTLPAEEHDKLVAVVSHVPHLAAGALMRLALASSQEQNILMRLAAGGFRDMTRIASGHPNIWLDICEENREAICKSLDTLIVELQEMREVVSKGDRKTLLSQLTAARQARTSLPVGAAKSDELSEVKVAILDRPGSVAEITILASQLNVNIYDLEIAHSTSGDQGVMILIIDTSLQKIFSEKLIEAGYRPSSQQLA